MTPRRRIVLLALAAAVAAGLVWLRSGSTQSSLRRITNTTEEGININPSISGDGRFVGFESTEDVAGAGGTDRFRAIRANISVDPPTFFQMGGTRAVAPGISQDGSRVTFASKDDPLGNNPDGNSEIFVFNGSSLLQVTNTTPGSPANRVTEGNFQPSISDDGRFIAFSSNRNLTSQNGDGNLEVFVFDSVAATFTQLTNSTGTVGFSDAKISGDGLSVACIRDQGATASANRDLIRINRSNSAQAVLAANVARLGLTYGRAISDDGSRVVYSTETAANTTQVFFYDSRSGNVSRQVTSLGARATEVPLNPTISGDGRRLAFATRRAVTGFTNSDASVELYTYDIPTGVFARITSAPAEADCFDGSNAACEVVSSLNDDGSTVVFNFPRALSGAVTSGLENKSEIYATGLVARPPFGTLTSILNQASMGHEPSSVKAVAPNSIAVAIGSVLANTTQQSQKQSNGEFPTNVGGTTVTVNGRSAQIFFVSPDRIHFLVPPQTEIGTAEVVVTNADGFASRGTVPTLRAAPGVFTKTGDGLGEGMILNADTQAEGPFDPTGGNLRLMIFATGVRNGVVNTVNIGGRVVNAEAVNPSTEMPGLDEVIVRVPADLRGTGTVNLFIQSDGRDSNPATVRFTGDPGRNIVINEVLADPPDGIAGDANHDGVRDGTQDEFIELVNGTTTETISLSGWTIRTRATGSSTETTRFTFATGTSLPAGEAMVVFGGGSFNPSDPIFGCAQVVKATTTAGLSLTNGGLTIIIRDASGNEIRQFSYGGSTGLEGDNNQSLTRSPDITGTYVQHTAAADANGRRYSPGLRTNGTPFGNCPAILTTVTIAPPSAAITVGQTQQFTAQAFDQFGRVMTGVTISFTSNNTTVATVESVSMNSSSGVATANVLGRNPGTAHITASATDGSNTVNSSQANLTVSGPSLSINDVTLNEGNSGTTTFTFTVSLSTTAPAPVTFDIATQDDTATVANNDYTPRSLTSQTIPAGQQTYTFDVAVTGDVNQEPTETFLVNVTNVSGATVTDSQGVGTIVTDDIPVLSINDVSLNEGNSGTTTFTFTVSSNLAAPAGGITFDIATQDSSATTANSDYVARSLTGQSIPAGQFTYTFDVTVNGDTTVEPNETFLVNISNVSANAGIADGQGVGTIQNDDTANLVISQVYGGGNNTGATFRNDFIEIYNRGTSTVDFALTPYSLQYAGVGSNFSSGNQTNLTTGSIAPGKYFLVQQAGGTANGVALPTPDATGSIAMGNTAGKVALVAGTTTLAAATCPGDDSVTPFNPSNTTIADFVGYGNSPTTSGHCYEGAGPAAAPSNSTADFRKAGGCVDTDQNGADFFTATPNPRNSSSPAGTCQPEITIDDVTITEGNSGTTNATFTVSLSAASAQTVTVNFTTAEGTATLAGNDYQTSSGMLTFVPGDTSETITVLVNGDTLDEANENFFVNLSAAVNAVLLDSQGVGTINDNDPTPSLSINDVSGAEGDTGTSTLTFNVSLSAASGQTVTVNFATVDNTATLADNDYQSNSGTLTFNPGTTLQTVSVTVNGDTTFEAAETFFVNLTTPTNATISDSQGQGTITNDDAAPPTPTFFITNVTQFEGNSGTTAFVFDVTLSPANAGTSSVDFNTVNGSATIAGNDFQSNSGTLTFAPGGGAQQITVLINGDTLVEPDETFTVHLSNATNGSGIAGDGTGTIQNDDTADLVISQTYPGGGLSGATYQNDYIELFNQGTTTVDFAVTPYAVQFLSTSGSTWAKTDLTAGTIAPGRYFLISGTSGGAVGTVLPTPDASGSLNLTSTTAGKVALTVGTTLLTGNCPGDDGSAPFNPVLGTIADFVGYGGTAATANHCYEGPGPAPFTLSNNTIADFRKFGGCQDTDDNAADFATATPSPRNTNSPINDCTAADLEITKTDSPDPVIVGSNVTYTITVTNHGPATATNVVVTDNLPANVTFVSCTAPGGTCNAGSGNNRTISFTSIAAGASEAITLVATADGPAGTPISNTASVSASTSDPNGANNSATTTTDVNNPTVADLSISKSDAPDPVYPTQTLTYTLTVTNNGPDAAQSVVMTDTLPAEVTFVDCASNQGGVCGGTPTVPTVTFASLASGVTATITINVTVNANVTAGTVITNNASVASATNDSNGSNNTAQSTTTVQEVSAGQLVISEFRTRGPAGASDEFVEIYNPTTATVVIGGLKIRASNGTGTISDRVTITAGTTLNPGCHYLLANTAYSGSVAANQTYGTGIGDDGGVAITRANGTTIIDQVGMSAGSAYKEGTPLAQLTSNVEQSYERKPGGAFGNGTDTDNNSADFFLNASSSNPQNSSSGCLNTSSADLSISKTDSPDPVTIGSNITYTITVLNNGAATAQNVLVTDNLPAEVSFVSCTPTGGAVCGGTGNNRTVTLSSLASGASFTATIVATANGPHGATASNTATVSSTTPDANSSNDSATATTLMQEPTPSLSIDDVTLTEGTGGTTNFVFTVTLSPASSQTVTVNYATSSISPATAAAGTDYTATSGMLTFTPSDTSEQITVQVTGDSANEAICETFFVKLTSPVNATISDDTGQGGITDDDGTKLVISQIYGGGGNTSATYTNDFIEIFNRGNTPVSLNGMSVQYVGATTTTGSWSKTDLPNVTLQPGRYFLVQQASGGAVGSPLPTPDATGTIAMAAGAGRVALVNSTTALSATACPSGATILDLVGYGSTAICREGASTADNAPGPSNNTTSAQRAQSGCQDLNLNGPSGTGDFSLAAVNPRNTSTAANNCSCSTSYSSFFSFGNEWLSGSLAKLTSKAPNLLARR